MELNTFMATAGTAFAKESTEHSPLFTTMDLGSTETRALQFTGLGDTSSVLRVNSNYAEITRSIDHVSSSKDEIGAKLEVVITDKSADSKTEPAFKSMRIVKGSLMDSLNTQTINTTANASKIDQVPTYVNVVFNTALMLLLRSCDKGSIPSNTVDIDITVSLPPEDTTSNSRLDFFKSRLSGTYNVQFPRLGLELNFSIGKTDITVISEPNAVAICQQAKEPMDPDTVVGFIDMGGRSSGYSFVRNGVLLEDSCVTEPIGGNTLKLQISQRVSEKFNIQKPTVPMIDKALITGQMRVGNKMLDISDCISKAKEEVANTLFNGFMTAMDLNNLQTQQLSQVYCSGRAFGVSTEGGKIVSPSILSYIEDLYHARSQFTSFEMISTEDPVVTGLLYARFAKV